MIFPGAAYTEKNCTYMNTEGRAQYARKVVIPPGVGKEERVIIRALSDKLNCSLPYDNVDEVRKRLEELAP